MFRYAIEIFYSEEDEGYIAVVPELAGCSAFGETEESALNEVMNAMELWLETAEKVNGNYQLPVAPRSHTATPPSTIWTATAARRPTWRSATCQDRLTGCRRSRGCRLQQHQWQWQCQATSSLVPRRRVSRALGPHEREPRSQGDCLRCRRFRERMRLVDQTGASWNHITRWLQQLDCIRTAV
jgi:predicted RNase H-like HicB family nuclease